MIKRVTILHRKPGMSVRQFSEYWRDIHGPLARALPGVLGYVQNHCEDGAPFDGLGEMYFESAEALEAALGSEAGKRLVADLPNFLDTTRFTGFLVGEVRLV